MAGDWIQMRHDLPDDPAVIGIAEKTDLDEHAVIGRLHRVWTWADKQTIDGNATGVTIAWLDRYVSRTGFAQAMIDVGWLYLSIVDGKPTLQIPKFDEYISESAKHRALTARRARKFRNKNRTNSNAASVTVSVTKSAPKEEKSIEENRVGDKSPTTPSARGKMFVKPTVDELKAYCLERQNEVPVDVWLAHYESNGWMVGRHKMKDWKAAVRTWEPRHAKPSRLPTPWEDANWNPYDGGPALR